MEDANEGEPETFLLTCRHVVRPYTDHDEYRWGLVPQREGVGGNYNNANAADDPSPIQTVQLIQPDRLACERSDPDIAKVLELYQIMQEDTGAQDQRSVGRSERRTRDLLHHCRQYAREPSRVFGTLSHSPPIGSYTGIHRTSRRDWALIASLKPRPPGTSESSNRICCLGLDTDITSMLLRTGRSVDAEGNKDSECHFVEPNSFFTDKIITMARYNGLPETSSLFEIPGQDQPDDRNAVRVFKYGATTRATSGILNHQLSYTFSAEGPGDSSGSAGVQTHYCIVGARSRGETSRPPFSFYGDSGSVVCAALDIQQYDGDTRPSGQKLVLGAVGLLWGGITAATVHHPGPDYDIAYAVPMEHVVADIERFCGRKVTNLERVDARD